MTRHLPLSFDARDELYNFDRNPRLTTHVLTTLVESSYQGNYNISNAGGTMPVDHPISWCQNYDGGRAYTQALGHLRERWYDARFLQSVLQGIKWAAGTIQANCVSHREVRELVAAQKSAGTLTAAAADRATALHQQRLHVLRAAGEQLRRGRERHRRAAHARPAARERRRDRPRPAAGQGQRAA